MGFSAISRRFARGAASVRGVDAAALPVPAALRQQFPDDWLRMATRGGEDYELLFALPPDALARLRTRCAERGLPAPALIGAIVPAARGRSTDHPAPPRRHCGADRRRRVRSFLRRGGSRSSIVDSGTIRRSAHRLAPSGNEPLSTIDYRSLDVDRPGVEEIQPLVVGARAAGARQSGIGSDRCRPPRCDPARRRSRPRRPTAPRRQSVPARSSRG